MSQDRMSLVSHKSSSLALTQLIKAEATGQAYQYCKQARLLFKTKPQQQ